MADDKHELMVLEQQFQPLIPQLADVLAGRMPPERLIRTVMMSVQRTPKILNCTRQSIFNAAMTFGVLGLEVDGVTGQGYILPFKDNAQPVVGYKGYNTIGARSRLSITGEVVRESDEFDYQLGTGAFVHHKPKLGNQGRIIAAWAQAEARDRPPIISILGLDDLELVRKASPGAKMSDSPWRDPGIGLPAMYSKTAKRRLARSTPLVLERPEFHLAARMDEAHEEQGKYSFISQDRNVVIEGEAAGLPARQDASTTPEMGDLTGPRKDPEIVRLEGYGRDAADGGTQVLLAWWRRLTPRQQVALASFKDDILKPLAEKADKEIG